MNSRSTPETPRVAPRVTQGIASLARYGPAIRSLGTVVCRSLFLPMIVLFLVWELRDGFDRVSLRGSICRSAVLLLPAIFLTQILRYSLRTGGLVERFFDWSAILTRSCRTCVSWILWGVIPLQFFYVSLQTFEQGKWSDSLGRLVFIASMVVLAIGLWRAAVQTGNWFKQGASESERFTSRFYFWAIYGAACSPLAIIGMSIAGYHYGAEEMGWRTIATVLLTILVALLTGFASRMLLVTQFKIKLRQLSSGSETKEVDVESIDIQAISSQVNRLLSVTALVTIILVGWKLWADVIPTNAYMDAVQLWQGPVSDSGAVTWITLRSVLTAIGIVALTFVLSRNLPGLLEITLLDRLPLDRGGRYAISFVCRYVVGILGILMTFQLLGFSWRSLQWLATGLTVGLGFGLQEIFANLVSGIIILIERPVRVGDFVTVNGTSGTVTRMQLRATTIQDLDYRELIVPNKKFITEDVMNWTLTDSRSRTVFCVGVAYGSDTELVQEKLLEIAAKHPLVVKHPEPVVVFSEFADSTLNFELRVHIPNRDVLPKVQHEVNMSIDRVFREANIEIAFPQQDLHIRSSELRIAAETLGDVSETSLAEETVSTQVPQVPSLSTSKDVIIKKPKSA